MWAATTAPGSDSGWLCGQGTERHPGERKEGRRGRWEIVWPSLLVGGLRGDHHLSHLSTVFMNVMFEITPCVWAQTKPWKYSANCVLSWGLQHAASITSVDIIGGGHFPRFFIKV